MATYEPRKTLLPGGLDEIGLHLSTQRLHSESLASFRQRLYLEARDPSGPTEQDLYRTVGRTVSVLQVPVYRVDLIRDGDNVPLAVDPFLEITSTRMRLYDDYANLSIDQDIDFTDHDDGYFLSDVFDAIDSSSFFSIEDIHDLNGPSITYTKSDLLRIGNSDGLITGELLRPSRQNRFSKSLVTQVWSSQAGLLVNLQGDPDSLSDPGDYYLDDLNGVLFTSLPASGYVSFTYRKFPYDLMIGSIRAETIQDPDMINWMYDTQISDETGLPEHTVLNSLGARIFNEILAIHPLGWGE